MQDPRTSHSWFSHDPSRSPDAKVFIDTSLVVPELQGDTNWTPFAAHSEATPTNVSASTTTRRVLYSPRFLQQVVDPSNFPTSPASHELSWLFEAGQFVPAASSSPTSGGNEEGPVVPRYSTSFYGATSIFYVQY